MTIRTTAILFTILAAGACSSRSEPAWKQRMDEAARAASAGDQVTAEAVLRATLPIAASGDELAATQAALADILRTTGHPAEAIPLYRQALAVWQGTPGLAAQRVAAEYGLAEASLATGDAVGARLALRRALADAADLEVASRLLASLAMLEAQSGDLAAAEASCREALRRWEAAKGSEAIELLPALDGLARVLASARKTEEADAITLRALAIAERQFGLGHPALIPPISSRIQVLASAQRWSDAIALGTRLLVLMERSTGTDNRDYVAALNQQIALLAAAGDFAGAAKLNATAVDIVGRILGPKDANLVTALRNGAELQRRAGNGKEAADLEQRAAAIVP